MDRQPAAADTRVVLEAQQPLSRSLLWSVQREFYRRNGPRAFGDGLVPYYITNNPFIAAAYADVIGAWQRELGAPVNVVELGAGSGRFAFSLAKALAAEDVRFHYVVTDFAEDNLALLRGHPSLRALADAGRLDFARFDAGGDRAPRLDGGRPLDGPLVVVANYVFDSLPHDAFRFADGRAARARVTLRSAQPEPDLADAGLLTRLELAYDYQPLDGPAYDEPELDRVIDEYRARLDGTTLSFPCAALRALRALAELAGGRLLLVTADKGYHRDDELLGRGDPPLAIHSGAFSMGVNYHAIDRWFAHAGGESLHAAHCHASLHVAAFALGAGGPELRRAFRRSVERFGPDDFHTLELFVERHSDRLTLADALAAVRMSGWDARLFHACLPSMLAALDEAGEGERRELRRVLRLVWDHYYPIGEAEDLAFAIAVALYRLGDYADALTFCARSTELYGERAATHFYVGLCRYQLGQAEPALAHFERALAIDPAHEAAKAMRVRLRAQAATRV
ncbi:MAG TPA: SAM-dependent methyltransferase [Polyangia bacterium]|nr:SAM-dependent methyltransferase [Polyangia bacterium]